MRKIIASIPYCLLGLLIISNTAGYAQDSSNYHSYTSELGNFYWPMAVPMYLHLSDQENGANSEMLVSNGEQGKDGGLYFQKEGLNFIRSRWAVDEFGNTVLPKQEIAFEVYIDGSAPKLDIHFETAPFRSADGIIYYGKGLSVSCSAVDTLSGLDNIRIRLNQDQFEKYSEKLDFENEGAQSLAIYAVDHVGNRTNVREYAFQVDFKAPITLHQLVGNFSADILAGNARIRLSSFDKMSGVKNVYYKFDDQEYRLYSDQLTMTGLKDGKHILSFYAEDNVRNEETEKTFEFYLDTKPPEIYATLIGYQYQNRGRVFVSDRNNVQLTATDDLSGVGTMMYRVDGQGDMKPYREPFVLREIEGLHVIEVYVEDKVKNGFNATYDENVLGRKGLEIDIVPPVIAHKFTGPQYITRDTVFINSKTEVALMAVDNGGDIQKIGYKVNGSNGQEYLESFQIEKEGAYTIDYFATDNVYNRNAKEFSFAVDNSGPELHSFFSSRPIGKKQTDGQELEIYNKGVRLYLAATDSQTETENIYFSVNNAAPSLYSAPIYLNDEGLITITVSARDRLGNDSQKAMELSIFIQ